MAGFAADLIAGIPGGGAADPALRDARVAVNRGGSLDAAQEAEVVRQFEAMLVRQMLKAMRSATQSLVDGSARGSGLGGSSQSEAYLGMFDGVIAQRLTSGEGLGLAPMLRAQLGMGAGTAAAVGGVGNALPPALAVRSIAPPAASAVGGAAPAAAVATRLGEAGAAVARGAFASAREFVSELLPLARRTARELGVSVKGLLAQMALETGWGERIPPAPAGSSSHNLFGIKAGAGWDGPATTLSTLEVEEGVVARRLARFRVYRSLDDSLADYARLLQTSPRYAPVLEAGGSVEGFARGLQDAGYATDPQYASKIEAIAGGRLQHLLDELGERT